MARDVPRAVVKVIELVGSSPDSFSDAVRNAVEIASESIRNIRGVEVLHSTAEVEDGRITTYKVNCKVAFVVEASQAGPAGEGAAAGWAEGDDGPGPTAHGPLPVA